LFTLKDLADFNGFGLEIFSLFDAQFSSLLCLLFFSTVTTTTTTTSTEKQGLLNQNTYSHFEIRN